MALDSIKAFDSTNRIHSRITGRLYKGQGITAANASIPSKYQTIVTNNSDRKGFNSRTIRFSDNLYLTDVPGPGNYECPHSEIEKNSTSFSKKGTGSFASKSIRSKKPSAVATPGAASYGLPTLLSTKKEFNRATCTSCFHDPIALKTGRDSSKVAPAPNLYNVRNLNFGKSNKVTAEAAFKSRTRRQTITVGKTRVPSPSHYNISHKEDTNGVVSSFASKTKRDMLGKLSSVPGPGAYKPFEAASPVQKQLLPRKHYLCISAPAMPLPAPPSLPGPGTYELVDYEGPPKHYMSSGVFVSNTSRWTSDATPSKENPGPSTYRPEKLGRQSFIYNAQNRWIPC